MNKPQNKVLSFFLTALIFQLSIFLITPTIVKAQILDEKEAEDYFGKTEQINETRRKNHSNFIIKFIRDTQANIKKFLPDQTVNSDSECGKKKKEE